MVFKLNRTFFAQIIFFTLSIIISYKKSYKTTRNGGYDRLISMTFRPTEINIPAVN